MTRKYGSDRAGDLLSGDRVHDDLLARFGARRRVVNLWLLVGRPSRHDLGERFDEVGSFSI